MKELIELEQAVGKTLTRLEYCCDYRLMEFDHSVWCIYPINPDDAAYSCVLNKTQLLAVFYKSALIDFGILDELEYVVWDRACEAQREQALFREYQKLKQKFDK